MEFKLVIVSIVQGHHKCLESELTVGEEFPYKGEKVLETIHCGSVAEEHVLRKISISLLALI